MNKNYHYLRSFMLMIMSLFVINITTQAREGNKTHKAQLKPWETSDLKAQMKEVPSKRNQFAKHFLNPDGSISMYTSPHSQHYKVGNEWRDIGFEIKQGNNQDYPYYNDENKFKTYYPSDITANGIITKLADGEMQENISSVYITDANGNIVKEIKSTNTKELNVQNGSITYNNVYPNAAVRYTQQNDGRKFDFVLQNKQYLNNLPVSAKYFVIKEKLILPNNWSVVTSSNGINMYAGNTWVANLPTPVAIETELNSKTYNQEIDMMVNGNMSYIKNGNEVTLTTKFPISWLKNNDRVYPVTLDPIISYYPENVANSTGYQTSATAKSSGYIRLTSTTTNLGWASFDITTLPPGATIAAANYYGYHYTSSGDKYAYIVGLQTVLPIPATTTGSMLNAQINSGPIYNSSYQFGTTTIGTWRVGAIGGTGLSNIAGDVAQGATGLGFMYESGYTGFMYQYGYNGTFPPYLEINYSTAPCVAPPTAGTSVVSPTGSVCSGSTVNLNLTGNSFGSGMTFFWQSSANIGGPYTSITGALIGPGTSETVAATTYFRCGVVCSLDTQYSAAVMVPVPALFPGGTYTINSASPTAGSNFNSFNDAVNAISCGIAGPIVFNVAPASGPYNEQVVIPEVATFSATNTVTFNGNNNTLTYAALSTASPTTLELNGADYIKFNNLNIDASSSTAAFACHLWNDANYNRFSNCTFTCPANITTSISSAFSVSGSATSATTSGNSGSYDSLINCNLFSGYYCCTFTGDVSLGQNGNYISGCSVQDFYFYGMYNLYQNGIVIRKNTVERPTRTTLSSFYGIYLSGAFGGSSIEGNIVRSPFATNTTLTSTCYPIYVPADGTLGNENKIFNNMVYDMISNGTIYAIYATGADYVNIYHNTVDITNPLGTGGTGYGIYSSGANANILNNIVTINRGGSGTTYCLYFIGGSQTSNHNVLVNTSALGTNGIGYYSGGFTTLGDWQTLANSGVWDAASIGNDPVYNNPISPTFDFTPTASPVNNIGTGVGVVDDINGTLRSVLTPDPGAIEFTLSAIDIGLVALVSPDTFGCYSNADSVRVTIQNAGSGALNFATSNVTLTANISGTITASLTKVLNTGTLAPNTTMTVTFPTTVNLSAYGSYTINAYGQLAGDLNVLNDTMPVTTVISGLTPGVVSANVPNICVSGTPILTVTGAYGGNIQWQSGPSMTGPWLNVGVGLSSYSPSLPITATEYYRTMISCNGNIDSSYVEMVQVNNPSIISTNPDSVCAPLTATLTATANGGNTVNWFANATGGSPLFTGNSFTTPSLTSTTTYYAEASAGSSGPMSLMTTSAAGNSCGGGVMFDITPNLNVTIDSFYALSTSSAAQTVNVYYKSGTYSGFETNPGAWTTLGTYSIPAGSTSINIDVSGTPLNLNASSTYGIYLNYASAYTTLASTYSNADMTIVTGTGLCSQFGGTNIGRTYNGTVHYHSGCAGTRVPVEAFVRPTPSLSSTPATATVCSGIGVTLTATSTPGITFSWTGGATNGVPTFPSTSTIYTVTASDAYLCSATATADITVNPVLTGSATATQTSVCIGDSAIINATTSTLCLGSVNDFAGMYAPINWTTSQNNSNGLINTVGAPSSIIITTGTNGSTLEGTTSYSIVMGCSGTVSFDWAYSTPDIPFLDRPRYQINSGISQDMNGFNTVGTTTQSGIQLITVAAGDTLHLQSWTYGNDPFAATITISNFVAPAQAITGSASIWDAATGGINLGNAPYTVLPVAPGATTYYVEYVTNGTGCANVTRDPIAITANPSPSVFALAGGSTAICEGNMTTLVGFSPTGATLTWSPTTSPAIGSPVSVNPTSNTIYTVTATNASTCTATSIITVNVSSNSTLAQTTLGNSVINTGTSNDTKLQPDGSVVTYTDASCNMIATIIDGVGGNVLGNTVANVTVDATTQSYNGQPYVRRWYEITPTNNGPATVTLYFTQAGFTEYNANNGSFPDLPTTGSNSDPNIPNIRITKVSGTLGTGTPTVITPTMNWDAAKMRWEATFSVSSFSQFYVHSANPGNVPLPATITNFSGRKLSTSNMLEWTTASEQNNANFNLQYARDGINFKTIAKVNSQALNGNSSSILNYNYEHMNPSLGHNYYRLEQVDIDNHSSMNQKVVDIIWGTNGSTVSIYPNPTKDVLNIDLYTSKVQNTVVKVLDMSGRIVKQIQARSEVGMNQLSISLGELASGIYTVQIFENNQLTQVSKVKKND